MRPLNQWLGDRFFDLLEENAQEAGRSVRLLPELLISRGEPSSSLDSIRKSIDRVAAETDTKLARTVMASLKKDDIDAVSNAFRQIPSLVQRIAERASLHPAQLESSAVLPAMMTLAEGSDALVEMANQLRIFDNLAAIQRLNAQLRDACDRAERQLEHVLQAAYRNAGDAVGFVALKDLVEQSDHLVEHCRGAGELISSIALKYS